MYAGTLSAVDTLIHFALLLHLLFFKANHFVVHSLEWRKEESQAAILYVSFTRLLVVVGRIPFTTTGVWAVRDTRACRRHSRDSHQLTELGPEQQTAQGIDPSDIMHTGKWNNPGPLEDGLKM